MKATDPIDLYRSFGLFNKLTNEQILQEYEEEFDEPFDPHGFHAEILALDTDRVWSDDPECVTDEKDQVYAGFIKELASISNGHFSVTGIQETWETDEGPITISFAYKEKNVILHPHWDNDWLDLNLLGRVNEAIEDSGYRFCCISDVNWAVVFILTHNQAEQLDQINPIGWVDRFV